MSFDSRVWRLGNVITLVVVLLSARVVYWTVVRADDLRPLTVSEAAAEAYLQALQEERRNSELAIQILRGSSAFEQLPQPVIQRTIDLLSTITRGTVYDRNGRRLAYDQAAADGEPTRVYAEPSLAHVIGYVSGIRAGISGLELSYNESLLGLNRIDAQLQLSMHQPIHGSDLVLTVDSRVQRAADEALAGKAGAVVVLDGQTGAVLAMASQPRYDPNRILDPAYTAALLGDCAAPECQGVFINRPAQGLYVPGSTFKTVTLIAALDTGQVTPQTVFDFGQPVAGPDGPYFVYEVGGGVIPDPNHKEAQLDLVLSFAKSANAAFARIGDEMPAGVLIDYAGRFGFSAADPDAWSLEIPWAQPQLASDVNLLKDNALLRASTAIGQGELLVPPLGMALVMMAAINRGDLPMPYLVEEVRSPAGQPLAEQPARRLVRGLMKPETADLVRGMLITAAELGGGNPALVPGLRVGGKTGTAQVAGDLLPHAWFIGFAGNGERSVVIAVMVENAGGGHGVAAPIFAQVADIALRHMGEPVDELAGGPVVESGPPPAAAVPAPEVAREPGRLEVVEGPGACPGGYVGPIGSGTFAWPVEPKFRGLVGDDFKAQHPGLDLGASPGAPVYAADAGVVAFSNWTDIGYGNVVVVDHGNGYQTLYAHLSQLETYCGANLEAGGLVGLAGATGQVFGPHLHFEIRVPGGFLNPWPRLPPP
jgi:peptidoglycan glycosyltransferase